MHLLWSLFQWCTPVYVCPHDFLGACAVNVSWSQQPSCPLSYHALPYHAFCCGLLFGALVIVGVLLAMAYTLVITSKC
jgi:hypothetical protein